jgi:hypothetical protein
MTFKPEYDHKVRWRDTRRSFDNERKDRNWGRFEREMRDDRMNPAQEEGDDEDTKEYKRKQLMW